MTEAQMSSRGRAGLLQAPLRSGFSSAGRAGKRLPDWGRAQHDP
jgi:hypothetical protein